MIPSIWLRSCKGTTTRSPKKLRHQQCRVRAPNHINGMVCCLGSLGVERARECVSRVCCHGNTDGESGDLRDHSSQSEGRFGESRDRPRGPRGTRIRTAHFFWSSPYSSHLFHQVFHIEGGGVLGERVADTPLPHHRVTLQKCPPPLKPPK